MSFFVHIATTRGPAGIRELDFEDEKDFRSQLTLFGQNYKDLAVSKDYVGFTGSARRILMRDFRVTIPSAAYMMAVDRAIDGGQSWQLGVFTALALKAAGKLETDAAKAAHVLWVTGRVHTDTKAVEAVEGLAEKLQSSAALFAELRAGGKPCTILLPRAMELELQALGVPAHVRVGAVATLAELLTLIGVRPAPLAAARRPWLIAGGAALVGIAAAALTTLPWPATAPSEQSAAATPPTTVTPPPEPVAAPTTPPAPPPTEPGPASALLAIVPPAAAPAIGLRVATAPGYDCAKVLAVNRNRLEWREAALVWRDGRAEAAIVGACELVLTLHPPPGAPVHVRLLLDGVAAAGLDGQAPLLGPRELTLRPTTRRLVLEAATGPIGNAAPKVVTAREIALLAEW